METSAKGPLFETGRTAQVPGSKETRVGVSRGNSDDDLRPGRRASPCMRLWALRMPTLPGNITTKVPKCLSVLGLPQTEPEFGTLAPPVEDSGQKQSSLELCFCCFSLSVEAFRIVEILDPAEDLFH